MTTTAQGTSWVRHILGEKPFDGPQRCIMCGMQVAPHILGNLPPGEAFEYQGRLALIAPDEPTISCLEQL